MLGEFDVIQRYFAALSNKSDGVELGIGDDAAIVRVGNKALAVATDTLIEGVHFPKDMAPAHVATRALGVNLSDFAAMGVSPEWFTLAITLDHVNHEWLDPFSQSLAQYAEQYGVVLVGGDTTRGRLSLTLTVMGSVKIDCDEYNGRMQKGYLSRSGACEGDEVWVTGALGKGAAALAVLQNNDHLSPRDDHLLSKHEKSLLQTFYAPSPRLSFGASIVNYASAAIDISDGLIADARHIAIQSGVKLCIDRTLLPVHSGIDTDHNAKRLNQWLLSGGDEYELLFTAPPALADAILRCGVKANTSITKVGAVESGLGVVVKGIVEDGLELDEIDCDDKTYQGYRHF